ncbi:MAG: hypothetical protein J7L72_09800 [Candidatus Aminicenantes bacterium]|nr:hypothetical protein [Candidatus Aminicenantes bacterium]
MADKSIFTDKEIKFLKELVKHKVSFIIVGLSAAALQGAPVVTQDIDLWFKDISDTGIHKSLKKVNGSLVPSIGLNPPMFAGKYVELFDIVLTMHGLKRFEEEEKNTIEIPLDKVSVKVLKLERIIKSKQVLGREKDKRVLPALKDALITIKEQKRRKENK